ncbi:YutD family protein [Lactiplantibacillus herbarum]|uniref:YutD family protein n=1 Tax=Lactiplantibacillus herbarum TaxID=1670446 RepID=UPI000AF3FC26|nr:YutD family protein [Lactiplantibacillus herbarum]
MTLLPNDYKDKKGGGDVNRDHIDELAEQQAERRRSLYHGLRTDKDHFEVNKHPFEIIYDYHEAFDLDKFTERFSSILSKYDYIVGDWGFEQLRLKGFFRDDMKDVQRSQTIGTVQDYLYEYCNFGCAYFIVKNERVIKPKRPSRPRKDEHRGNKKTTNGTGTQQSRSRSSRSSSRSKQQRRKTKPFTTKQKAAPFKEERQKPAKVSAGSSQSAHTTKQTSGKRHFTIRQK